MRVVLRLFLCLLIGWSWPAGVGAQQTSPTSVPQNSIWFEARLGHVVARPATAKDFLAYGYYLTALGPKPATATKKYGQQCLKKAVDRARDAFRNHIAADETIFGESPDSPLSIAETQEAFNAARVGYRQAVKEICLRTGLEEAVREHIGKTSLALVKRECAGTSCDKTPSLRTLSHTENAISQRIFEVIYYWALDRKLDVGVDLVVKLELDVNWVLTPRIVEVQADPAIKWPKLLPQQERYLRFEKRAAEIYRQPALPTMSAVVASQISLPRETVLRIAGAFDDPLAAHELAIDLAEHELSQLEDEVARIRLHECHNYRDKASINVIAECAGYDITQNELLSCLNGEECMPKRRAEAKVGALLVSANRRFQDLANGAVVPRPFDSSFGKLVDDAKACATTLGLVGQAELTSEQEAQLIACAGDAQVPSDFITKTQCWLNSTGPERVSCALNDDETWARIQTFRNCASERRRQCVLEAALPADLACIGTAKSAADLTCLPGEIGRAASTAKCLKDHSTDYVGKFQWIAAGRVDGDVGKVLGCYAPNATKTQMATCLAGKTLPEKEARIVSCAAESGGDYVSAAVCVAAPNLGLKPGQQILLQCAASTGGEPISFATCTAGQFTMRELVGCRNADFEQPGCFGHGNEFQKLAKALTGEYMSRSSVAGKIIMAHFDAANAAITGFGRAAAQLKKGTVRLRDEAKKEFEEFVRDPVKSLVEAPENILTEGGKVIRNVVNEGVRLGGKIESGVRNFLKKPFG